MENTYGYIITSRQRIAGETGSDPEVQVLQLRGAGVALGDIYRDVGVSGSIGTNSRAGWHTLDGRLTSGDTLVVVAIDRIGQPLFGVNYSCRIGQLVLPVHLLLLVTLLSHTGAVAGQVKFQYDRVMDHPVNGRGGGHGVDEDVLPLGEDQVGGDAQGAAFVAFGN